MNPGKPLQSGQSRPSGSPLNGLTQGPSSSIVAEFLSRVASGSDQIPETDTTDDRAKFTELLQALLDHQTPAIQSACLRPEDAGPYLSLSPQRLAKLRLQGRGPPFIKVGRSVLYPRADLDAWVAANRRASTSDRGNMRGG